MAFSCSLPMSTASAASDASPGEVSMRANELLSPPIQHTFATKDVADFDDAISGADDEVELRLLNAMVPVPKMRRTRERRPDADDDVARG